MAEEQQGASRLSAVFDLSRRENRVALLLAFYYMLVLTAFTTLKPTRNSLLLDRLGEWLPIAMVLTAVVTGLVVWAVDSLGDLYAGRTPVLTTTLTLLAFLLLFRQLFETAGDWVALPFYIFVNIFSLTLLTQFRLVAGNQFTPREAKRLFGVVGAGGTLGGILGPTIVFRVVERVGTENLIYVSAIAMVMLLPLVVKLERLEAKRVEDAPDEEPVEASAWSLLKEHRHIKLIGAILGASMIASAILDVQFQTVTSEAFASADEKTFFFAKFFAAQNVIALFIQLIGTRYLLMRFGVGFSLVLLPFALASGAIGFLIYPTLLIASGAKFAEGGIRYSLQEATTEVLYLPLPSKVRSRVRPLIDMFGTRLFDGLGGLMILFFTAVIGLQIRALSVVSLVIIVGWFLAVFVIKREYLSTVRSFFADVSGESQDRAAEVLDTGTVQLLAEQLEDPDEMAALSALAMLDLMHDKESVLAGLGHAVKNHPSEVVRSEALSQLGQESQSQCVREAEAMLDSQSADVRVVAVRYLCRYGRPYLGAKLNSLLEDEDSRVRIAAMGSLALNESIEKQKVRESLEAACHSEDEDAAAEAGLMLGTIDDTDYDDLMIQLLRHDSPIVVRSALEGVSRTGRRIFLPLIVPHLSDEGLVIYAQRAIRSYGDRVVHALRDYIDDPAEPVARRRAVAECYAAIGTQAAADALLEILEVHQAELGMSILEALGEINARLDGLEIEEEKVTAALRREVDDGVPESAEGKANRLRVVVGLLGLIYPREDVTRAYIGLMSGEKDRQSNALELLDNLFKIEHKRMALGLIEACVA